MSDGTLPLLVLGAGGHAKVLVGALKRSGARLLGLVDPDPERHGALVLGVAVLGGDEVVHRHPPGTVLLVNGLGSVGSLMPRAALYQRFHTLGYRFARVIDPAAVISEDVTLGEGCQLLAGAIIQPGAVIGDDTIVNTGARIDHDTVIGSHCHIAPAAVLSGGVVIENLVHIGTGAAIRQGIRVGAGAVVGLGAAVVAEVPAGAVVAGVPAKRLTGED